MCGYLTNKKVKRKKRDMSEYLTLFLSSSSCAIVDGFQRSRHLGDRSCHLRELLHDLVRCERQGQSEGAEVNRAPLPCKS